MSPPARSDDDALAVFCQDTLRSGLLERQPYFAPDRVRALLDRLAVADPAERAAAEGVVLRVVSTCLLHDRFGMTA